MVNVWFVRKGPEPTRGGPAYELPLQTCIETLSLSVRDFLSGPDSTPRFGDQFPPPGGIADYRHVVCEIEDAKAAESGWKPGYYRTGLSLAQAIKRLGPPRKPRET